LCAKNPLPGRKDQSKTNEWRKMKGTTLATKNSQNEVMQDKFYSFINASNKLTEEANNKA
jgi:hypothetical protein